MLMEAQVSACLHTRRLYYVIQSETFYSRGVKLISAQGPHGVNLFSRGQENLFSKKTSFKKNFSFLKKKHHQKDCKIISRAALNPVAGRMHNIRKNHLSGHIKSVRWPHAARGPYV